jgi:predicted permease
MGELLRRLHYLLNRRRLDKELENDMEFHREMAAREGRRNFGNSLRLREQSREAWGWTWLDRLMQDLQYGVRILLRAPGFTLMATLILAIGIGVNVSAFSLFNTVALKPLPVRDPKSIVRLERHAPSADTSEMAYPSFAFYRDHSRTLSSAMAVLGVPPMQLDEDVDRANASFVTSNYFEELGTRAAFGRMLAPSIDDAPGAAPVIVIRYEFWEHRLNADPSVIGRVVHLNGKPLTIVGVLPYDFASLGGQGPDIWLPMIQQPYLIEGSKVLQDFDDSAVRMWGRLAPGVSTETAEQELRSLTDEIRRQHPTAVWDHEWLHISPGSHALVMQAEMARVAEMVGILTLLILAVACTNLGALQLARGVMREHEISIRLAIGANRRRIFRQLCTESFLLAALGACAGLALASIVVKFTLAKYSFPKWMTAAPDWRVLLFAIGVSVFAALFFGLAPALQIARQRQRRTVVRQILIGVQVAASCVLLIVSGLLVRATQHALFTDPGFGYESTLSIDPQLGQHGYTPAHASTYFDEMQSRLRAVPGVRSVSLVRLPPMGHTISREDREINGRKIEIYPNWVSPGYFQTMEIPLLAGRTFLPGEKNGVIVSAALAHRQWGSQNPIGQTIPGADAKDIVIGVAGDAHVNALNDDDAVEEYWPPQPDNIPNMVMVARVAGRASSIFPSIRAISESIDPKIFPEMRAMKALYREIASQTEQIAAVVTLIGVIAALLAGVGIVGLVAFTISQRSKEIAIRLALGSRRAPLCVELIKQFLWPVTIGLLLGAGFSAVASRFLRLVLFGVSNLDPVGYATGIAFLLTVILVAAIVPVRRALRLNVARALHQD